MSEPLNETIRHQGKTRILGLNGTDNWVFDIPASESYSRAQLDILDQNHGSARISSQPALGSVGTHKTVAISWAFNGSTVADGFVEYKIQVFTGPGTAPPPRLDQQQQHNGSNPVTGDNGADTFYFNIPANEVYAFAEVDVIGQNRGGARISAQPAEGDSGDDKTVTVSWWFDGGNPRNGNGFIHFRIRAFTRPR